MENDVNVLSINISFILISLILSIFFIQGGIARARTVGSIADFPDEGSQAPGWSGSCDTDIEWSEKYDGGKACPMADTPCPPWFSSEIMTQSAGTRKEGNDTIPLYQCKKVCQREGLCLDKEGFDSLGFNPTSGALKNGGAVPVYYSGDISCQSYPCEIRVKGSGMPLESLEQMSVGEGGEIVSFRGVIGGNGGNFGFTRAKGDVHYESQTNTLEIQNGEVMSFGWGCK